MRDSSERRLRVARGGVLMFVLTLGWTAWQNAGPTPVSAETPPPSVVGLPHATHLASPLAPIRIDWLNHCGPVQDVLGLYMAGDGVCVPSGTATLTWLQSQLTLMRVLSEGEYLQRAATGDLSACGAFIVSADVQRGWICLDDHGLYRLDRLGQISGARWQLQADGSWLFVH